MGRRSLTLTKVGSKITINVVKILNFKKLTLQNFKAYHVDKNDKESLINKGFSLFNLKRYQDAIECYDKALAIDQYDKEALNNKGYSLQMLGKYREALECFDEALLVDSADRDSLNGKGLALRSLNKYEEAIECFNKVLLIDPNDKLVQNIKAALTKLVKNSPTASAASQ